MSIFFTSDLHLGHNNVIRFDNRPFFTVKEMDETIVKNWNNKVKKNDTVYILGDVSWYGAEATYDIVNGLNGMKILIMGNHDRISGRLKDCFKEIVDYKEIDLPDKRHIVMCHYPIPFFNKHYYGAYMLYGHVHNSQEWIMTEEYKRMLEGIGIQCNMFNVGTMLHDYTPVTLEEIEERFAPSRKDGSCQ